MKKSSITLFFWGCFLGIAQAQTPQPSKSKLEVRPMVGVSQHNWVETNRFADLPSVGGAAPRTSTETATLATVGVQIKNNSQRRFKFLLATTYLFGNTNFDGAAQQRQITSAGPEAFQTPLSGQGRYAGRHTQLLIGYAAVSNRRFSLTPRIGFTARRWQRNLPASPDPMVVVVQRKYALFQFQSGLQMEFQHTPSSRFYASLLLSRPLSFTTTSTGFLNVDGGQTIYERSLAAYVAQPFPKTPESIQEAANVLKQMSDFTKHTPFTTAIGGFRTNINLKMGYEYKRWSAEFYYDSFRFAITENYTPSINGYMTGFNVGFKIGR
ncbi:MAG: hypothetical protein EAZ32_03960 [Cytophagia bacterium]|nr:MAG: hypothetical protein EAZ46_02925 [Runella sp.]TAG21922.1 MAG: hypothetical protein EAZ38_06965 [Cytophagales bacterium]TAG41134.1 MAG: hypothetical protein EAZ32_03960 [Cytophagia bacterium]TAG82865.1 MAG: hypothetical protein EAZ22_04360 [Cytophagales bacterium]